MWKAALRLSHFDCFCFGDRMRTTIPKIFFWDTKFWQVFDWPLGPVSQSMEQLKYEGTNWSIDEKYLDFYRNNCSRICNNSVLNLLIVVFRPQLCNFLTVTARPGPTHSCVKSRCSRCKKHRTSHNWDKFLSSFSRTSFVKRNVYVDGRIRHPFLSLCWYLFMSRAQQAFNNSVQNDEPSYRIY